MGAAALPLFAEPARALEAVQRVAGTGGAVLQVPTGLSGANLRAATIAAQSPLVRAQAAAATALAREIGDARLRDDVLALLHDPRPRYGQRYATTESRLALRDAMAREGFVAANAPVDGLFPPIALNGQTLPFWAAPGSETTGHHNYPGGLCAHELFNARMGAQFAQTYDRQYFDGRRTVNRDVAVAAAFYHDIMKTIVFQYRDDGSFLPELSIGATGGHHVLSGAEAIVRGRDARFVTVLLSAHAAPSLGDEAKVVLWCRAAALIAGVDPVEYGLVKKTTDGYALASLPPIEAFVNHLSDHDFVLAIPAAEHVDEALASAAPQFGVDARDPASLAWWRLRVCSRASNISLYHELTRGNDAFISAVRKVS